MDAHHLHRILSLLGDHDSREITGDKYGLLQFKWNNFTQRKYFFQDIGKQPCVLGLLPLAEIALHISQTPLPIQYKYEVESYVSLRNKIDHVIDWADSPSKQNKRKLLELPPARKQLPGQNLPVSAAESFINNLVKIIVVDRKFPRYVWFAVRDVTDMGYHDYFAGHVFRENVLAIYRDKLKNQTAC